MVRTGRRINSRNEAPDEKLTAPKRCTKMVFGPSAAIESRSEVSKPRMSDVIPTMEVTPMTTPSTVSAERILLPRSVSNAIARGFAEQAGLPGEVLHGLFAPQRFDRVEHRGTARRIPSEEQADRPR